MDGEREKPEAIVSKLRQDEVLQGQGATIAEAIRQVGVTQQTSNRWRKLYGGMQRSQLARLKVPQKRKEKGRLWLNCGSCVRLRPKRPNHVWSYDFVQDRTANGRV